MRTPTTILILRNPDQALAEDLECDEVSVPHRLLEDVSKLLDARMQAVPDSDS